MIASIQAASRRIGGRTAPTIPTPWTGSGGSRFAAWTWAGMTRASRLSRGSSAMRREPPPQPTRGDQCRRRLRRCTIDSSAAYRRRDPAPRVAPGGPGPPRTRSPGRAVCRHGAWRRLQLRGPVVRGDRLIRSGALADQARWPGHLETLSRRFILAADQAGRRRTRPGSPRRSPATRRRSGQEERLLPKADGDDCVQLTAIDRYVFHRGSARPGGRGI